MSDPLDKLLMEGATLVCCRSGDGIAVTIVVYGEIKYEVAHGRDLRAAIGNLWEKVNARNQQADHRG